MRKGKLIVISGPSGVGKGTVVKKYLENNNAKLSISATSRSIRKNEIDKVNYYFMTNEEFEEKIKKGEFLEYAKYNNCYYGTPKSDILKNIENGVDVLLEIEYQGALQIKKMMKESILIFLLPPSIQILEERLRGRMSDSDEIIKKRMKIAEKELEASKYYDYKVVNDSIKKTVIEIENIIKEEKNK